MNKEDLTPENIYDNIDDFNIYGYVYLITNNINGKNYVGQRKIIKDNGNWDFYYGSGETIKNAIKKYGKENFTKTLLDIADTPLNLSIKEDYYITEEQIGGRGQYNKTKGIWRGYDSNPKDPQRLMEAKEKRKKSFQETKYKQYLERIYGKEQQIIDTYKKLGNIKETAKTLNLGATTITKFLHENNIELNSQNKVGRKQPQSTKDAIKTSMINYKMELKNRLCEYINCLREYKPTNTNQRFCSPSCREEYKKSVKVKNINKSMKVKVKETNKRIIKIYFKYCFYKECNHYFDSTRRMDKYCSQECKELNTKRFKKVILPEDPDIIKKLYWDEELSATKIALQYNCNEQTIRNYMKKYEIPVRNFSESSKISHKPGSQERIESSCLNCKEIFNIQNFKKHYNYCITRRRCLFDSCEAFIVKKNKSGYCKDHYTLKKEINICDAPSCEKILRKENSKNCRKHLVVPQSTKRCPCGRDIKSSNYKRHFNACKNR